MAELGVNIDATVPQVEACLNELGIGFCFAPLVHPSMRHVAAVRKQLGIRTIFNILGPLVNPAGATHQLLGAGRPELRPLLAGAMLHLGTERTLVVSGEDGLGDVTLAGITQVTEVANGKSQRLHLDTGRLRHRHSAARWFIGRWPRRQRRLDPPRSSTATHGPARDLVILNAAAGLIAFGKTDDPQAAAAEAAVAIDSGAAETLLARLAQRSHEPA